MKRGVGLYFDNTMPYYCQNPLTSQAFLDDSGKIHPAATIWEQREYYQRVWTLMNELMAKGISPFPLGFTQHVTNTCVLPLNTWNTASLDMEWRWYDEERHGNRGPRQIRFLSRPTCCWPRRPAARRAATATRCST